LRLVLDGSLGPLDDEQVKILRLTEGAADRLSGMIHDLLDLACLEAGAMEYDFRMLDLREIARATLAEFEPSIQRKGLVCELDLAPGPVRVPADRALLGQVLQNLISNAVKFTPRNGALVTSVRAVEEGGRMSVADSGPGIPDAEKERVFERFHRSDPKAKGSQGTGLGLAIAHGIVAGHGGRIWVEDRPGGGSEFAILLPSSDSAPSGGDASSEGEEA
jgi:signal transduction histidine kinase